MKIFPDTKIFIICPGNIHSGGPELCHQLCSRLVELGADAYMFYTPNLGGSFNPENPIDSFYKKYHVPYVLEVEDKPHNILVVNESANVYFSSYKRIRKIFYWMSVDNYITNISSMIFQMQENALAGPMPKFFYFDSDDKAIEHWTQSEYARRFVLLNGVPEKRIYVVEDYLNQAFLSNAAKINLDEKKDVVAFNPAKGYKITQRLMEIAPDITWFPIKNMTPQQVQILLSLSKIYIDFGNHPGKDRIPREAALSGCVVITGRRGAAGNDVDINIPREFKFGETEEDFPKIIEKIRETFDDFTTNYEKQNDYRKRILDDKNRFAQEVAAAFNLNPPKKIPAAITQGFSPKGYKLTEMLSTYDDYEIKFLIDDRFCNGQNSTGVDVGNYIRFEKNESYFLPKTGGGRKILVISSADANFLYLEGRLKKFAFLDPEESELENLNSTIRPKKSDVLVVN